MRKLWIRTFWRTTCCWLVLVLGGFFSASSFAWDTAQACFVVPEMACGVSSSGNRHCIVTSTESSLYFGAGGVNIGTCGNLAPTEGYYPKNIKYTGVSTCQDGATLNPEGLCVTQEPCPEAGVPAIPSGQIGYGESAEGSNPTTGVLCDQNQCEIAIGAGTSIPIGGGLQGVYISSASYTGQRNTGTCPLIVTAPTPNDPSLPKPLDTVTPDASTPDGVPASQSDCPAGSAFGQVNGVNVCSPPGSQQGYVPDTTTTTNNGIEGSSTKAVVKTVGEDGSVTTTTTTNSTFGGNSSTTTTTSNNGGSNGLNGADGADGKDADPIDFGPAPSAESGDAPTVPGLGPGSGADGAGGAAKTLTIGNHFTGSGSCIADRSVNVLGVTVTVPLSELCPWFDVMYKVVSLMAVFAAMRILVMS